MAAVGTADHDGVAAEVGGEADSLSRFHVLWVDGVEAVIMVLTHRAIEYLKDVSNAV